MESMSILGILGMTWTGVTAVLVALVVYRAIVGIHEEDQIYLNKSEAALEREQTETIKKIGALDGWIKRVGIVSIILALVAAGIWFYQGLYGRQAI